MLRREELRDEERALAAGPAARHGGWLLAAATYNVLWGSATLLVPNLFFDLAAIPRPNYPGIWQVVGLFVLL